MVFDLVFPKKCLECGRGGKYLCADCLKKVRPGGWYRGIYSIWHYEGVIRRAILSLKYKFVTDLVRELAEAAAVQILDTKWKGLDCLLVPVPLHRSRLRQRGFNQAEILGKALALKLGWGFAPDLVIRTKKTKPQVETKTRTQRLTNLTGAFGVAKNQRSYKPIVIFDDVATTGSTVREIKKVLEKSGVKKAWGLTLAS